MTWIKKNHSMRMVNQCIGDQALTPKTEGLVKDHMKTVKALYKAKVANLLKQLLRPVFLKITIGKKRQFIDSLSFMNPNMNPLKILKSCEK